MWKRMYLEYFLCISDINQKATNKVKDIDINNHTYYFFNNIIKIKKIDRNNMKTDEAIQRHFYLLHYICDKQRFKNVKNNSVNHLYLILNKAKGYIE